MIEIVLLPLLLRREKYWAVIKLCLVLLVVQIGVEHVVVLILLVVVDLNTLLATVIPANLNVKLVELICVV